MQIFVLFALVCAASAAPQIVPYVHEEIAAEPYIHEEIPAEPYVHEEPPLTAEALGQVVYTAEARALPVAGPIYNTAPVQAVAYAAGNCRNNLGAIVPCAQ